MACFKNWLANVDWAAFLRLSNCNFDLLNYKLECFIIDFRNKTSIFKSCWNLFYPFFHYSITQYTIRTSIVIFPFPDTNNNEIGCNVGTTPCCPSGIMGRFLQFQISFAWSCELHKCLSLAKKQTQLQKWYV